MSHGGPPLYRCAGCGCPVNDHAVDFGERRECTVCECRQYLAGPTCAASCGYCVGQRLERRDDTWPLNLAANLAAAGMAAVFEERIELMYESYTSSIDLLMRHSFADSWLAIGLAATMDKIAEADCCHQGIAVDAVDTMREAVS